MTFNSGSIVQTEYEPWDFDAADVLALVEKECFKEKNFKPNYDTSNVVDRVKKECLKEKNINPTKQGRFFSSFKTFFIIEGSLYQGLLLDDEEELEDIELNYLRNKVENLIQDVQKNESILSKVIQERENLKDQVSDALEKEFTCGICNELYYQVRKS